MRHLNETVVQADTTHFPVHEPSTTTRAGTNDTMSERELRWALEERGMVRQRMNTGLFWRGFDLAENVSSTGRFNIEFPQGEEEEEV
jgi:hypothetical protein